MGKSDEIYEKYRGGFTLYMPGDRLGVGTQNWITDKNTTDGKRIVFLGYDANLFPMPDFDSVTHPFYKEFAVKHALKITEDFDGDVYLDGVAIKEKGKVCCNNRYDRIMGKINEFLDKLFSPDETMSRKEKIIFLCENAVVPYPQDEKDRTYIPIKDVKLPHRIRKRNAFTPIDMYKILAGFEDFGVIPSPLVLTEDGVIDTADEKNIAVFYTSLLLEHQKIWVKTKGKKIK